MTDRPNHAGVYVPGLLSIGAAAEWCSLSRGAFGTYVQPHLAVIRLGRATRIPLAELERFAADHAETPIADQLRGVRA
jgi:hypothetical protein